MATQRQTVAAFLPLRTGVGATTRLARRGKAGNPPGRRSRNGREVATEWRTDATEKPEALIKAARVTRPPGT
ncbi:hypothetical protein ACFV0Y_16535 [Streptomyces sp. NPDC059569]|uniref:hypothetical protein n=1 Tax=Streptomyces sp. NPDC059569 TaxID=3346869 RepID=UPI0036BE69EA